MRESLVAWEQRFEMTLDLTYMKILGLLKLKLAYYVRIRKTILNYNASLPPVSTPPPRFFNFGMPPAKSPPSCGGWSIPDALLSPFPWSLLLRARFPGIGGASPPGALEIPGTAGAPFDGGGLDPPETTPPPTIGADLSFVTAFLRAFPLVISWRSAPYGNVSIVAQLVNKSVSGGLQLGVLI